MQKPTADDIKLNPDAKKHPFQSEKWVLGVGEPFPLGANVEGDGVNFALFSANATAVELCLFDDNGEQEVARIALTEQTQQIWHVFVHGLKAGQLYGYRVYGSYEPQLGHRFNPNKLLLDPYARQLVGEYSDHESNYGYELNHKDEDLSFSKLDNAAYVPKCKVVDISPLIDIAAKQSIQPVATRFQPKPIERSIIYEMHVKGFTAAHPEIEPNKRATFAGLATQPAIDYLAELGVTCVELLPVQAFFTEPFLLEKKLTNYWGYNSIGFFAPEPSYLSSDDIGEFRAMVDALHGAGIEVILDVVYNHSAEGSRLGPTFSFRGIDNLSYYRLHPNDKRFYINDTGCGNTLNINHPRMLQLVLDSLRYWVEIMGVDGFRFDLAACLGREAYGFDPGSGFFDALLQDPVLCRVKLIAEPWDIGPGGYQLGNFPVAFSEWNDRYRDTMRRFWRGDHSMLPEFARRFHGSGDFFEHGGRPPATSLNFLTSHDGFTLKDLVSYTQRHNLANGEDNRDGHQENFSHHYGIEGETEDSAILALRSRQQRNLLTTLFLSQGVPMLLSGDETGRTQQGNNNAYCQDNELNWFDWSEKGMDTELLAFTQQLIALRKRFPLLCAKRFIHEQLLAESLADTGARLDWFSRQGEQMTKSLWTESMCRSLSVVLSGDLEGQGKQQALLLMVNADDNPLAFTPPTFEHLSPWQCLIHTQTEPLDAQISTTRYLLQDRSLMLFHADLIFKK
ncbi:glycogen debranching protein GlgX [Shewanella sp. DAU305]|uniref:glycogen debranching protein GlgX n=1 Tax=Shewanella sp. DAU305 TaxID=2991940 RepID=UPI0022833F57|nr:glycogen debranching protein GlgX [Shewanella sp. DAU305]WAL80103.1 glycogen debranching protein GlgX [Shewanella sp. DAU305]